MSIWCSHEVIGYDSLDVRVEPAPRGGEVRSYATGWSNHYPTTDGTAEQPGAVSLATIPSYCVPGHADADDWTAPAPWVRLDVSGWEHDFHTTKAVQREFLSVVLDVGAARTLALELLAWADGDHTLPEESA